MGTTYFMHVPLSYIPPQTRLYSLHGPTYNASVQESAILCIHCSDRYVLPKYGWWPVAEQLTQTKRVTAGVTGVPA